eukprot:2924643-Pleurochrysis_carterae.AAC.6
MSTHPTAQSSWRPDTGPAARVWTQRRRPSMSQPRQRSTAARRRWSCPPTGRKCALSGTLQPQPRRSFGHRCHRDDLRGSCG